MITEEKRHFGLLEYLSFKAGCAYLSELPEPENVIYIQHALRELRLEWFSLKEWNDAAEYITRQGCSFGTAEQAWSFLLNYTPPKIKQEKDEQIQRDKMQQESVLERNNE